MQYPHHPLAMYQVSGEYAMFWHASEAGAIDLRKVLMETLSGMRRAGMCYSLAETNGFDPKFIHYIYTTIFYL